MSALDDALASATTTRHLDLSGLGLTELPNALASLRHLVELDISDNRFASLPRCVLMLPRLRVLIAHGCGMTTVPHGFPAGRYTELQLGRNPIIGSASAAAWTLPAMIAQCSTLEVLGLDAVSACQPGIEALRELKRLRSLTVYGGLSATDRAALTALVPRATVTFVDAVERTARRAPSPEFPALPSLPDVNARVLHPQQAALRVKLTELLAAAQIDEAALDPYIRPSIVLTSRDAAPEDLAVGATRLGGEPDLAPAAAWPEIDGQPMSFLAQVRLTEVAAYDGDHRLPPDGVLSFFVHGLWCGAVLYSPDGSPLARRAPPDTLQEDDRYPVCGLSIAGELSLPPPGGEVLRELALDHDVYTSVQSGFEALCPPRDWFTHQMLGWLDDEYDPKQLPEMELLLALNSDDHAQMNFGDANRQYFYLDVAQLAARDFASPLVACGI